MLAEDSTDGKICQYKCSDYASFARLVVEICNYWKIEAEQYGEQAHDERINHF